MTGWFYRIWFAALGALFLLTACAPPESFQVEAEPAALNYIGNEDSFFDDYEYHRAVPMPRRISDPIYDYPPPP